MGPRNQMQLVVIAIIKMLNDLDKMECEDLFSFVYDRVNFIVSQVLNWLLPSKILVQTGSNSGFIPDGTKPLSKPMLIYSLAFIPG